MPDALPSHDGPRHDGDGGVESAGTTVRDDRLDDGVVYPECDNMGESSLQFYVNTLLVTLLRDFFAAQGRPVWVSSDQFFYYRKGDPRAAVSPDVYVVDDEPPRAPNSVPSWKVWEHDGKVPSLALEVVSDEYRKDYAGQLLERYHQLGVHELIRYDPGHADRRARTLLAHWVRDPDGRLVPRPTLPDRVLSAVFGFWLVLQPDQTLRLGLGPRGETLWPTPHERAAAEAQARKAAEDARKAAEDARKVAEDARKAAEDARKADRQAAEAELARMQAELARLRGAG